MMISGVYNIYSTEVEAAANLPPALYELFCIYAM